MIFCNLTELVEDSNTSLSINSGNGSPEKRQIDADVSIIDDNEMPNKQRQTDNDVSIIDGKRVKSERRRIERTPIQLQ